MFRFTIRDVLWLTVVVAIGLGWRSALAQSIEQGNRRPSLQSLSVLLNEQRNSASYRQALEGLGRYPDNMAAIRLLVEHIDEPPSPAPKFTRSPLEGYIAANALLKCTAVKVRTAIFESARMNQSERKLHMMAYVLAQLDQEEERPFSSDLTVLRLSREIKWVEKTQWQDDATKNLRRMISIIIEPRFSINDFPQPAD